MIRTKAQEGPYDIVVVEIGGTVGDIENIHFIEAAREMLHDEGRDNVMAVHVTQVPYNEKAGELKTKPTQHSVKALLQMGIQPDIIVCRSGISLNTSVRQKISLFCNIAEDRVISSPDTDSIYRLPTLLDDQKTVQIVAEKLNVNLPQRPDKKPKIFDIYLKYLAKSHPQIRIAITGKYTDLHDSYVSILNALDHSKVSVGVDIVTDWIDTTDILDNQKLNQEILNGVSGIIVPGGFGERGAE